MKASDYLVLFHAYAADTDLRQKLFTGVPTDEIPTDEDQILDAVIAVCRDMLVEARDIHSRRHGQSEAALVAVLREQHQKFKAFARLANVELCKCDREIVPTAFAGFLMEMLPDHRATFKRFT